MISKLTDKTFWENHWEQRKIQWDNGVISFIPDWHDSLYKELLKYSGGNCLEVGCFPGRYMRYFSRFYNMKVDGIDLVPGEQFENNISQLFNVYTADFLEFKSEKKYDVVCSFGFIEHFENVEEVVEKHLAFLKENGLIIITIPNFVHGWQFVRKRSSERLFVVHNKKAMELSYLKEVVGSLNCKSWSISMVRFSSKNFSGTNRLKRTVGNFTALLTKRFPVIDEGLSTEILIKIQN